MKKRGFTFVDKRRIGTPVPRRLVKQHGRCRYAFLGARCRRVNGHDGTHSTRLDTATDARLERVAERLDKRASDAELMERAARRRVLDARAKRKAS